MILQLGDVRSQMLQSRFWHDQCLMRVRSTAFEVHWEVEFATGDEFMRIWARRKLR